MKIKYSISYRKGSKPKKVTGFLRVPRDLHECFTSDEAIEFLSKKHSLDPAWGLDIKLHNYTSKRFNYGNTIKDGTAAVAKEAARSRN